MNLWGSGQPSEPDRDSFTELELPTTPASPQAFNQELYELVGKLMRAQVDTAKRVKGLAREIRNMNRKQTVYIGTIMGVMQAALEFYRQIKP